MGRRSPASSSSTGSLALGLLLRILGRRSEAEEVLQEVFLQVWMQADRYDAVRSTPRGWILMLARSRALDRLRRRDSTRRREEAAGEEAGEAIPPVGTERLETLERQRQVTSALGLLVAGTAALHRARLLRGAHPHADRRTAGGAARHGQIPDPAGDEQATAGTERAIMSDIHTTPHRGAPPRLRAGRAGRRGAARAGGASGRRLRGVPPPARPLAGGSGGARRRGAAGRAVGDHPGAGAAPGGSRAGARPRRCRPRRRAGPPPGGWRPRRAALLALALWGLLGQVRMEREVQRLAERARAPPAAGGGAEPRRWARMRTEVLQAKQDLQVLAGPGVQAVTLAGLGPTPGAKGRTYVNPSTARRPLLRLRPAGPAGGQDLPALVHRRRQAGPGRHLRGRSARHRLPAGPAGGRRRDRSRPGR